MTNTVHIPSSVKEINKSIARKITILAEQQAVLTKTRCKVRRHSRQLHVDATRQQILELRQARKVAILDEEARQAQAFVASLAPLREDFLNGLFD
jgi:hypothetical protein|tara:strand:+ start:41 stop:325 length:285 start_codon:yes stop_codon:yes gene_type:complete